MKFIIKVILVLLFFTTSLFSCTSIAMLNSYNGYVTQYQLDSLCNVEQIPYLSEKWISYEFLDPEDNSRKIYQYTYIKSFMNKNNDEIIYVVTNKSDSIYKFTKRVTTKIKN